MCRIVLEGNFCNKTTKECGMSKKKYAVFTMDVEAFTDTDCVRNSSFNTDIDMMDGLDEFIRILDKYGIKSTLFTVGQLASKISDRLRNYIKSGHRLALHGYEHIPPMSLTVEQFKEHIARAKRELSELFGIEICGFRAPCFSMDNDRLNVLKELNFKYDSSHLGFSMARHTVELSMNAFKQLRNGIFCDNGFFEFGLAKQKFFGMDFPVSGGGYIRLNNWLVAKNLIKSYLKQNDYYVFYLHPFELTKQHIPFISSLKSYDKYYLNAGIKSYGKHIEELIQTLIAYDYEFVTFEELADVMATSN